MSKCKRGTSELVWQKLAAEVRRLKPDGSAIGLADEVAWMKANALVPPEAIKPEDVPSVGALWGLKMLQEGGAAAAEFFRKVFMQVDAGKAHGADALAECRPLTDLIDRLLSYRAQAEGRTDAASG